jgi:hypothetical protein
METGLTREQVMYLREVLGLESVVIPRVVEIPISSATNAAAEDPTQIQNSVIVRGDLLSARLVCLASSADRSQVLIGERDSLAEKMMSAMKLPPAEVAWIEWHETSQANCPDEVIDHVLNSHVPLLCFGEDTAKSLLHSAAVAGQWVEWSGVKIMITYSLNELLERPEKKKPAWAHLQAVMKVL